MSPLEREYLLGLEPELRGSAPRETYPPRRMSRALAIFLGAMRVYVISCIVLVVLTFIKVLHR